MGSHGVLWQRRRGAIRPANRALVARLRQRKPTVRLRALQVVSVLLVLLRLLKLLGAVRVEVAATKQKQTPLRTSINECIHKRNGSRHHVIIGWNGRIHPHSMNVSIHELRVKALE